MSNKYGDIHQSGGVNVIGDHNKVDVDNSTQIGSDAAEIADALAKLAVAVRESGKEEAGTEAEIVESAAKKAKEGDLNGATSMLKRASSWVLDAATKLGSAALAAYIKTQFG